VMYIEEYIDENKIYFVSSFKKKKHF